MPRSLRHQGVRQSVLECKNSQNSQSSFVGFMSWTIGRYLLSCGSSQHCQVDIFRRPAYNRFLDRVGGLESRLELAYGSHALVRASRAARIRSRPKLRGHIRPSNFTFVPLQHLRRSTMHDRRKDKTALIGAQEDSAKDGVISSRVGFEVRALGDD